MKPKFARLLSPPTAHRSTTLLLRPGWALYYQPPDREGPHLIILGPKDYVRTHGQRLWLFTPKG